MMLTKDIELLEGLPVAYIKSLDALAVSDLHLGYEGVMAKKGTLLPKVNFSHISKILSEALKKTGAKSIIVDGDIKNEFSTVDEAEFNELYDFINFCKGKNVKPILIKGNHDNFVERYKEPFKLQIYGQEALIGKYLFFHGEELPQNFGKAEMLIMGHEHPAIGISKAVGPRERLACFLYGKYGGKALLVLPAMNYYAPGSEINLLPEDELLSPVFGKADVGEMHAIVIGYGETIDFGSISKLRKQ